MRLSDRVFLTLGGDSGCSLSHQNDCNAISFRACAVTRKLQGCEIWKIRAATIRLLGIPGHSDDILSFLLQTPSELLAFTGDTVFQGGRITLQDTRDCRPADYMRSLRALGVLPIDGLFPGHGVWSLTRGAAQI